MLKVDPVLVLIFSDLFINLAAGWFGAAIIIPLGLKKPKIRVKILLLNFTFGIMSLMIAYIFRRL